MCISNFFNDSCDIQHTSTGINSDGCPVNTITSTETVPCFINRLSASKSYVSNVNSHFINTQAWMNSAIDPLFEEFNVEFLSGCTLSGDIEITLGSEATVVIPITSTGEITAIDVATAISLATFTNWTVTALDDLVNFKALVGGVQTPSVIDTNSTGVTMSAASFIEVGTDGSNIVELTDKIVHKGITYWVENVDNVVNMSMGQCIDLSIFK